MTNEISAAAERVRSGFDEAVANWTAHCECLCSDDHRKSPYWLPITECWSERRMQDAATLANFALSLIADRDETNATDGLPVDEAWLRSIGGNYKYDGENIDENYIGWSTNRGECIGPSMAIYLDDMNIVLDGTHVPDVFITTRGQLLRLLSALNITTDAGAK
jgi:hypothetical protein